MNKEATIKETKQESALEVTSKEEILNELELLVEAIVIENTEQFGKASELLKKIKQQITGANKIKLALTKPFRDLTSGINEKFKIIDTRAKGIQKKLEGKILSYNKILQEQARIKAEKERQEEIKRIEEERKKELEKQKKENELKNAAFAFLDDDSTENETESLSQEEEKAFEEKIEAVKEEPIVIKNSFKTSGATTNIRKVPTYEVIDISLLPKEYMMPDNKKIMQALNMGARLIPGLKITEVERITSR
jgi:hypothetical protein